MSEVTIPEQSCSLMSA